MKPPKFNPDWSDEVLAVYQHDMEEMWDPMIARHIWNQYHNQLAIYFSLISNEKNLRILDIGCAQGTLALLLAEQGHHVWAMDIRKQFLEYAATRHEYGDVHFVAGNVFEMEFGEQFDVIFANQVLEHLVYPLEFLKRIAKWLEPGGRVIATTPNGNYVKNRLPSYYELGDPKQYEFAQFGADGDSHFFAYTERELMDLFTKAGLSLVKVRFFETPWMSGHMKVRYLHPFVPLPVLKLLDHLCLTFPWVGKSFSYQLLIEGALCP